MIFGSAYCRPIIFLPAAYYIADRVFPVVVNLGFWLWKGYVAYKYMLNEINRIAIRKLCDSSSIIKSAKEHCCAKTTIPIGVIVKKTHFCYAAANCHQETNCKKNLLYFISNNVILPNFSHYYKSVNMGHVFNDIFYTLVI